MQKKVIFSRLSLIRAVPKLLDGLKPGQRKVIKKIEKKLSLNSSFFFQFCRF